MSFSDIPFRSGDPVVAYMRDSGHEEQDLSIAEQTNFIRDWCSKAGLVLSRAFIDEAKPGSSTISRTAFKEMVSYFHASPSEKGIILWKFSRFSRDIDDAQFYKADLRRRGYIIYSINDNVPDTADGRVFETMIDWMNHRYLEDLSIDVKRGLNHIVQQYHAVPGHPPPGFKTVKINIGSRRDGTPHTVNTWVIDEEEEPIIQEMWKMRAAGAKIAEIHRKFHILKARTSYEYLFRNRIYIGELWYAGNLIPDFTRPMIDLYTWETVQKINAQNKKIQHRQSPGADHPRRKSSSFLLSGLLHCVKCGSVMNGRICEIKGKKRNDYYICTGARRNMECDARAIHKDIIEPMVMDQIREYLHDPEIQNLREQNRVQISKDQQDQFSAQIKRLTKDISENDRKITNLNNHLATAANAPASTLDLLNRLETQNADYEREKAILESKLGITDVRARTPAELQELARNFDEIMASEELDIKRRFIKRLVNRVAAEIDGDKIRGIIYMKEEDKTAQGAQEAPARTKKA